MEKIVGILCVAGLIAFLYWGIATLFFQAPRPNKKGEWVTDVIIMGTKNGSVTVFRQKYKTLSDAQFAGVYYTNRLRKKIIKSAGPGSFDGSIKFRCEDAIITYKCFSCAPDPFKYAVPLDYYCIR